LSGDINSISSLLGHLFFGTLLLLLLSLISINLIIASPGAQRKLASDQ
jgi:hypothetical protein